MQHTVAGILSIVNLTYESKKLHPQLLLVTFTAGKKIKCIVQRNNVKHHNGAFICYSHTSMAVYTNFWTKTYLLKSLGLITTRLRVGNDYKGNLNQATCILYVYVELDVPNDRMTEQGIITICPGPAILWRGHKQWIFHIHAFSKW